MTQTFLLLSLNDSLPVSRDLYQIYKKKKVFFPSGYWMALVFGSTTLLSLFHPKPKVGPRCSSALSP